MRDLKSGVYEIFLSEIQPYLDKIEDEAEKKEKTEKAMKRLREYEISFDKEVNAAVMRLMDNLVYKLKNDVRLDFDLSKDKFDDILRKKMLEHFFKLNK